MLKYRRAGVKKLLPVRLFLNYILLANFVQKTRLPSGSEHVGHFVHLSAPLILQTTSVTSAERNEPSNRDSTNIKETHHQLATILVQQPSRHFYLNLAKIPPNQVIADFGRGSSVESESE